MQPPSRAYPPLFGSHLMPGQHLLGYWGTSKTVRRPMMPKVVTTRRTGAGSRVRAFLWGVPSCMQLSRVRLSFFCLFYYASDRTDIARDPRRRCRRSTEGVEYPREALRRHTVRPRPQHNRIHERHLLRHQWQHCTQVRTVPQAETSSLIVLYDSMEIGSAYALQVCLIQAPAMLAFSAYYSIGKTSMEHRAFT